MSELTLVMTIAAIVGLVLALSNWRWAFLSIVLVGFLQDPLRKVIEGEPVYLVVMCSGAMVFALLGAMGRHGAISLRPITIGNRPTQFAVAAFVGLVVVQAALAWARYSSPMIAAIGLLAYLSPIPAIWLAYHYARGVEDVRRFLLFYVSCAAIVTTGIYLSKFGFESPLLGEVGEGLMIYDLILGQLDLHSGMMRSPEVGAWHAGAATCLLIVLAVSFRGRVLRFITPAAVLFFMTAGILTGRRKVLVVVAAFAVIYMLLLFYYRQRSARRALFVVAALSLAIVMGALSMAPTSESFRPYVERGTTVFAEVGERITNLGLASIAWGYEAGGFFGLGAGAGSQGTQHFTGGESIAGGAAEGGLGKIVVELGVPGLLLAVLATVLVARNVKRILALAANEDVYLLRLSLGMVAFAAANIPAFVGASQIYGDPFVLFLLGSVVGFVFAVPRILQVREKNRARREALQARNHALAAIPPSAR